MLIDGRFISRTTLEKAMERQQDTGERLGAVLVRMGVIEESQLNVALSIQKNFSSFNDAVKIAAGTRRQLGEMLIDAGRITNRQLKDALAEQKNEKCRIGSILVRRGHISERELHALLMFQGYQCINNVCPSPLRLGRLLASTGHVTGAQVAKALKKQISARKEIGQVLADSGCIKQEEVFRGLRLQQMLVTTVLKAVLSLASAPHGNITVSKKKNVVTDKIKESPAPATARVLNRKRKLTVNNSDIKRGYIDVKGGAWIEISSSLPGRCMFSLDVDLGPFSAILIDNLSDRLTLSPVNGTICFSLGKGPVLFSLNCRFFFSGMARPGLYAWPVRIRAHTV